MKMNSLNYRQHSSIGYNTGQKPKLALENHFNILDLNKHTATSTNPYSIYLLPFMSAECYNLRLRTIRT
jgi:hypothetical protein